MKPTVLIVDDRDSNLEVLEASLFGLDVDIRRAASGPEAIAISSAVEPAVVLLDIQMPGMDGHETAQALRRQEGREHVPIIFITAHATDAGDLLDAYSTGAVDYLLKPIDPAVIRAKVGVFASLQERLIEIRQLSDELRRRNEDLDRFAYAISHDLRQPLRGIIGFGSLLARRYGEKRIDEEFDEYVGFIAESASRLDRMILDLLQLSRLGRAVPLEEIDLAEVLDDVELTLRGAIEESGARIERGPLPRLTGNRGLMVQVLQNLIDNSIKFRGEEPPIVRVEAVREGETWLLSVADNGRGIPPREHRRIFDIFRRADPSDGVPGNGMGLALVKKIVEQQGGRIGVRSAPGEGTVFEISLPVETRLSWA